MNKDEAWWTAYHEAVMMLPERYRDAYTNLVMTRTVDPIAEARMMAEYINSTGLIIKDVWMFTNIWLIRAEMGGSHER